MDLVGDLERNLSVDLPSCGAHTRKSWGGGESSLQEKYKPANNNKGATRTVSVLSNGLALFTKFAVAKPLANRPIGKPHLNKIDISLCDSRDLLIALVMS